MNANRDETQLTYDSSICRKCGKTACAFGRFSLVAACGVALTLSTGCSWWRSMTGQTVTDGNAQPGTARPATTQYTTDQIAPTPPNLATVNRAVVQGTLPRPEPLVYLVDTRCSLRVRNVGTDEEIIRFEAKSGQIVRVDSTGVYLANKPVIGAKLAPGEYAIDILPPTADGIRSTQQRNVLKNQ